MYYNFFIQLSVNGQLKSLHIFPTVNNIAMNFAVHMSSKIVVFSEYMPGGGVSRSYGVLFVVFFFFLFY